MKDFIEKDLNDYCSDDDEEDEDYDIDQDSQTLSFKTVMEKTCQFEYLSYVLNTLMNSNSEYYSKLLSFLPENKKNELNFYLEQASLRKTAKNK